MYSTTWTWCFRGSVMLSDTWHDGFTEISIESIREKAVVFGVLPTYSLEMDQDISRRVCLDTFPSLLSLEPNLYIESLPCRKTRRLRLFCPGIGQRRGRRRGGPCWGVVSTCQGGLCKWEAPEVGIWHGYGMDMAWCPYGSMVILMLHGGVHFNGRYPDPPWSSMCSTLCCGKRPWFKAMLSWDPYLRTPSNTIWFF